jgi:hypothetical protein
MTPGWLVTDSSRGLGRPICRNHAQGGCDNDAECTGDAYTAGLSVNRGVNHEYTRLAIDLARHVAPRGPVARRAPAVNRGLRRRTRLELDQSTMKTVAPRSERARCGRPSPSAT